MPIAVLVSTKPKCGASCSVPALRLFEKNSPHNVVERCVNQASIVQSFVKMLPKPGVLPEKKVSFASPFVPPRKFPALSASAEVSTPVTARSPATTLGEGVATKPPTEETAFPEASFNRHQAAGVAAVICGA